MTSAGTFKVITTKFRSLSEKKKIRTKFMLLKVFFFLAQNAPKCFCQVSSALAHDGTYNPQAPYSWAERDTNGKRG